MYWIGRYREDIVGSDGKPIRVRKSVVLGDKKQFPTKRLAERQMDSILARINALDYRPGKIMAVEQFAGLLIRANTH